MSFMFPMPDDIRAELEQQRARGEMEAQSIRHQVTSLFNDLDKEHLHALRILLSGILQGGKQAAAYYEGIVSAKLEHRFGVCPGCGMNHEEELFDQERADEGPDEGILREQRLLAGEAVQESLFAEIDPTGATDTAADVTHFAIMDARQVPMELKPSDLPRMEEYNLDDVRDEDTLKLLGFICKGCGLRYQSIDDRAMQPVDGCHGCIDKAKWG